jgi:hypothetical protein
MVFSDRIDYIEWKNTLVHLLQRSAWMMYSILAIRPEAILAAGSIAAIVISLAIFMIVKQKLFKTRSFWQNAVIAILFITICALGQFFLIRLAFFKDGAYMIDGLKAILGFIAICLVPVVIAVVPAITLLLVSKHSRKG